MAMKTNPASTTIVDSDAETTDGNDDPTQCSGDEWENAQVEPPLTPILFPSTQEQALFLKESASKRANTREKEEKEREGSEFSLCPIQPAGIGSGCLLVSVVLMALGADNRPESRVSDYWFITSQQYLDVYAADDVTFIKNDMEHLEQVAPRLIDPTSLHILGDIADKNLCLSTQEFCAGLPTKRIVYISY